MTETPPPPLNIMYRIDGSSDLKEESLEHWSGYRGARPVRIGNGTSDQLQLDIYGDALDSIFFADERGLQVGHRGWIAISEPLDWLAAHSDQLEDGIWNVERGAFVQHYGITVLDSSLLRMSSVGFVASGGDE